MTRFPRMNDAAAAQAAASHPPRGRRRVAFEDAREDVLARPSPQEPARRWTDFAPLAAALAWGAGFIHATVTPEHFGESLMHGLFFVAAASAQFVWGVCAYHNPSRRVLVIGAIGSCAIAAIWVLSRTVGLPVTIGEWRREPIEGLDVIATVDELATAALIVGMLGFRPAQRYSPTTSRLLFASVLVGFLVTASLFGPMLAAHHHS